MSNRAGTGSPHLNKIVPEADRLDFDRPYCLIHMNNKTFYAKGLLNNYTLLAQIPRKTPIPVISMVPYTQLRERQFMIHDGGEKIISLVADTYREVDLPSIVSNPCQQIHFNKEPLFDMKDTEFENSVKQIIDHEIYRGEGSNFLLSRKCRFGVSEFTSQTANLIFSRLVRNEFGAYMTFCFFDGERYFIGSSPERNITIDRNQVYMNPICGTLPKTNLKSTDNLLDFLTDQKEINELFQVVDEELKMMSQICDAGGEVRGPFLKEMSSLIHTEYVLAGNTEMDLIDAFRLSMYAATMIGSPLENAARIIKKYEKQSRRYYSSAIMITGIDENNEEYLDSAITIRTMEVTKSGQGVIQAGASIVRDSIPAKESYEIKAKAQGLLHAMTSDSDTKNRLTTFHTQEVDETLNRRNENLSQFWINHQHEIPAEAKNNDYSALIIDNKDEFTKMLAHVLLCLGMKTTVCSYHDLPSLHHYDLVVIGPGPGNPNNLQDEKIKTVHAIVRQLIDSKAKFLAICLGHQILCRQLGLTLVQATPPLQGVQKAIDLFDQPEFVGFYNTFFAIQPDASLDGIEICSDPDNQIIALRSQNFYGFQFHVESVLTTNGVSLLQDSIEYIMP